MGGDVAAPPATQIEPGCPEAWGESPGGDLCHGAENVSHAAGLP